MSNIGRKYEKGNTGLPVQAFAEGARENNSNEERINAKDVNPNNLGGMYLWGN